jgi:hypothetical protein
VPVYVQRFNKIEPDGAKALDGALEKMTHMKMLYLVSFVGRGEGMDHWAFVSVGFHIHVSS